MPKNQPQKQQEKTEQAPPPPKEKEFTDILKEAQDESSDASQSKLEALHDDEPAQKPAPEQKPAAEAKPAAPEKKTVDTSIPANIKSDKAIEDFKALRTSRDEAKSKIAELEKEIQTLKSSSGGITKEESDRIKAEIAEAKSVKEEYEAKMAEMGVTSSYEFKKHQAKKDKVIEKIKAEVGEELIGDLSKILQGPPSKERKEQITVLLADLDDFSKDDVFAMIREHDSIREEEQFIQSNPKKSLEALNEKRSQMITSTLQTFSGYAPFRKTDDPAWNSVVETNMKNAQSIAMSMVKGELSPEDATNFAVGAVSREYLENVINVLISKNQELQSSIDEMKGSTPTIKDNAPTQKPAEKTFLDIIKEANDA